ncbi:NlpC/P60 family protein [Bacillus pumilus]|nr:NlpC/P60 family protein [Bacillus pumilus]
MKPRCTSFDCSSFVRWAFASAGINLGPVAVQQQIRL